MTWGKGLSANIYKKISVNIHKTISYGCCFEDKLKWNYMYLPDMPMHDLDAMILTKMVMIAV